jgi:hypothetical protein
MEEEENYHKNYNPPWKRDIYSEAFWKIRKKVWKKLKKKFICNLVKEPNKLIESLKRKNKFAHLKRWKLCIPNQYNQEHNEKVYHKEFQAKKKYFSR